MVPVIQRIWNSRSLTIALIWPVFTIVTVVILAALAGIFVMWLTWVGVLIGSIAISDLAHRLLRRVARAHRQAIG